ERFYEDATRILRALRFACQLSFGIEQNTWEALKKSVPLLNNTIMQEDGRHAYAIAREMIGREFLLGFVQHPTHAVNIWKEAGVLDLFLPEVAHLPTNFFQKTLETLHTLQRPALLAQHNLPAPSPTLLVAALFTYTGDDRRTHAHTTCKNLYFHQFGKNHFAHINCKDVFWLVDELHFFEEQDPAAMRPSHFEKKFCNERGQDLLLFMHAVAITSGKHSIARERLHTARRILEQMMKTICPDGDARLPHLINGNDLQQLGMKPGPHFREIKNHVRDAQLIGKIQEKDEALEIARHYIRINT
ncbi:MAG: hypothetical protein KDD60_06795, partial [Bdellovibrionales bacterium]|nr:hypothetical protein [Bdellovibrionales bacterium]